MTELLSQVLGHDWENALIIILNLIIIESLLSVDNAAVLATMVLDLPPHQRSKALRYGILGAYIFRGLCLLFAAWLIKIWWLKPLGGLYLLYLTYDYFKRKATPQHEDDLLVKEEKWFYKLTNGLIGQFWATVVAVEIMDLAFSLDNVFAAVAFTDNIYLICVGVFIGILAMRFVAQWFVKLLETYPFLETSAFLVIGILGLKLFMSLPCHFYEEQAWARMIEGETADLIVSVMTASFFFVPILTSRFFGWPEYKKVQPDTLSDGSEAQVSAQNPPSAPVSEGAVEEKKGISVERQAHVFPGVYRQSGPLPRYTVRASTGIHSRYFLHPLPYERIPGPGSGNSRSRRS